MAITPNLLSLPLEIRRQIYSYLIPNAVHVNLVRDDTDGSPRRKFLLLVCRDIFYEVFSYYYPTNVFHRDLTEPA